jgi:hypothetical protein
LPKDGNYYDTAMEMGLSVTFVSLPVIFVTRKPFGLAGKRATLDEDLELESNYYNGGRNRAGYSLASPPETRGDDSFVGQAGASPARKISDDDTLDKIEESAE